MFICSSGIGYLFLGNTGWTFIYKEAFEVVNGMTNIVAKYSIFNIINSCFVYRIHNK